MTPNPNFFFAPTFKYVNFTFFPSHRDSRIIGHSLLSKMYHFLKFIHYYLKCCKVSVNVLKKKHVFGSFSLNNSEKHRLSFEDFFLGTLDTYTKKKVINLRQFWGVKVHRKVCWLCWQYVLRNIIAILFLC